MNALPLQFARSTLDPGRKIRVLVVDDSVVIRHLLRQALQEDPEIEVVGVEANGALALAAIPKVMPDLVTLDIEMPEMDGLEALRQIRQRYPKLRTIMFSTLTTRGGAATFEALSRGADDYVAKSANGGALDRSLVALRSELIPKVKQFFAVKTTAKPASPLRPVGVAKQPATRPAVLAIGVSTGGPQALAILIPALPADFPLPIVVVQHMPPTFTRLLAERLDGLSRLSVVEAEAGMELVPGRVIVARGDYHLKLQRVGGGVRVALDQAPHENSCRPSADVLFRSVAECYQGAAIAAVLTGMGSDGMRGVQALKAKGAFSVAQDEASSVVWGMPGAVVHAGLADSVLPLDAIAPELDRLART